MPGATDGSYTSNSFVSGDIVTCKVTNMDPCAKSALKSVSFGGSTAASGLTKSSSAFTIAPNPNNGMFTLYGENYTAGTLDVSIINQLGQVVFRQQVVTPGGELSENISLKNLPAGIYMMQVATANSTQMLRFTVSE